MEHLIDANRMIITDGQIFFRNQERILFLGRLHLATDAINSNVSKSKILSLQEKIPSLRAKKIPITISNNY